MRNGGSRTQICYGHFLSFVWVDSTTWVGLWVGPLARSMWSLSEGGKTQKEEEEKEWNLYQKNIKIETTM